MRPALASAISPIHRRLSSEIASMKRAMTEFASRLIYLGGLDPVKFLLLTQKGTYRRWSMVAI
jgi:hypothetical protein